MTTPNPNDDDWGTPSTSNTQRDPPERGRQKRKASTSTTDLSRFRCSGNRDIQGELMAGPIYDAISWSDDTFMELLFESMPERQLRNQMARVSKDWCASAYTVLRRKIGDRVFSMLYSVSSCSDGISLKHFFHARFLCLNKASSVLVTTASENRYTEGDKPMGYIERTPQPAEVGGIISFGNMKMEAEMMCCQQEEDVPCVDVFVNVLSQRIFFTSPDFKRVGDSWNGFSKPELRNLEAAEGKYLSSFLFPRSSHFALDIRTLSCNNQKWSLEEKYGKSMLDPSLITKAFIVFKNFVYDEVEDWITETVDMAFERGSTFVTVISGVYSYVGTSFIKPKTTVSAVGIALMGDPSTSVISVGIDLGLQDLELVEIKFSQMSAFINGDRLVPDTCFALLFCYFENGIEPESNVVFAPINEIMEMFNRRFPRVPVQAICSLEEFRHEQATPNNSEIDMLNDDLERLEAGRSRKMPSNKIIFLLVKYPLDSKSS